MTNEEVYLLFGFQLGPFWCGRIVEKSYNEGSPCLVSFESVYDFALKNLDKLIGFYHTHPSFTADYSTTDHTTMCGWSVTSGKPLMCLIQGVDRLANWCYTDEVNDPKEFKVHKIGKWFWGFV